MERAECCLKLHSTSPRGPVVNSGPSSRRHRCLSPCRTWIPARIVASSGRATAATMALVTSQGRECFVAARHAHHAAKQVVDGTKHTLTGAVGRDELGVHLGSEQLEDGVNVVQGHLIATCLSSCAAVMRGIGRRSRRGCRGRRGCARSAGPGGRACPRAAPSSSRAPCRRCRPRNRVALRQWSSIGRCRGSIDRLKPRHREPGLCAQFKALLSRDFLQQPRVPLVVSLEHHSSQAGDLGTDACRLLAHASLVLVQPRPDAGR